MKSFSLVNILALSLLFSFNGNPGNSLRDDVLKYTNEFRRSNHLAPLQINADMNAIAQRHSQNMASGKSGVGHQGFAKRTADIKKKLSSCASFAENVAFGASNGREAVELWKTSPTHRKNMLGNYKYIGIGVATSRSGQIYFTQIFAE